VPGTENIAEKSRLYTLRPTVSGTKQDIAPTAHNEPTPPRALVKKAFINDPLFLNIHKAMHKRKTPIT
jgi:hypothetical protein